MMSDKFEKLGDFDLAGESITETGKTSGEVSHWAIRKIGSEVQYAAAHKVETNEVFILAFQSEEDAKLFLIKHDMEGGYEPVFLEKMETKH